ncbi:MAG: hypothetical protein IKR70_05105 [Lachnospiraceae bacterium]|nr:hypothetical protein [Lachnospiraceae bacterium]
MKKKLMKAASLLLASVLALGSVFMYTPVSAKADEVEGEFDVFVAVGANEDWSMCYAGEDLIDDAAEVNPDITVTNGTISSGGSTTVSVEFANPVDYVWYVAPTIVVSDVAVAEFEVELYVDGEQVEIDTDAGDPWWYEATGNFDDTQTIRLAGGYNEWGTQYVAEDVFKDCTKIEYKITCVGMEAAGESEYGAVEDYDGEFTAYVAFGCNEDWDVYYYDVADNAGVTQDLVYGKVGDTLTLTATLDEECGYTWFIAPVLLADNIVDLDVDVSLKIDGEEVEIDAAAGDEWWYEATGSNDETRAIRLYGGYNEWGTQYIESPVFTTVEYTVTINSASVGTAAGSEDAAASAAGEVDLDGEYNAYIGIQSPTFSFRNAWYDSYGMGTPEFSQITGWDENNEETVRDGVIQDAVIKGNGTYTVSITDLDLTGDFDSQDYFNLIFVDTDIPNTGDITISDMVLTINGAQVDINPIISPDSVDYLTMLIQNIWNEDVATIGYYNVATQPMTIEITFTVSGFNYDNDNPGLLQEDETDAAAPEAEEATAEDAGESSGNTGLVVAGVIAGVAVVGGGAFALTRGKKKDDAENK